MASPLGLSTYFEHIDSKKNSLRKAILALMVEWKDLDEHLDSTNQCFDECVTDLKSREKILEKNRESVADSNRELDAVRKSLDSRFKELEHREECFRCFQQARVEEFEVKEKQLGAIRTWIEQRADECGLKEERLCAQQKLMEGLLENIETEKREFENIQKSVGEKLNEINLKERNFEERTKELDLIRDRIERRAKELDSIEEQLKAMQKMNEERSEELDIIAQELDSARYLNEVRGKELDVISQELDSARYLNEVRGKELDVISQGLDSSRKLNEERSEKLDSREKQLKSVQNYINQSFNDFHSKSKQLKADQKLLEERFNELKSKDKEYEERTKDFEVKEKQLEERSKDIEWNEKLLEERSKDLESKEKQLEDRFSYFELKEKQLVEQLNEITLKERNFEERTKEVDLIRDWIERRAKELDLIEEQLKAMQKLNEERSEELDSVRYLNEVRGKELDFISQGLDSSLKLNEEQGEKLDSEEKQLNSVQNYINQRFNDFHSKSKRLKADQKLLEERYNELKSKDGEFEERTKDFEAKEKQPGEHSNYIVWKEKLLEERSKDLESKEKQLEEQSKHFELKKKQLEYFESKGKQLEEQSKDFESKKTQLEERFKGNLLKEKQFDKVIHTCPCLKVEQVEEIPALAMNLPAEIQILVTMDGRGLQSYLNEHLKDDFDSMSSEVYKFLRLSLDPAKLVLDAMEGFYPPHLRKGNVEFKTGVVRKSCILLLEQLMTLSPQIRPHVREEALRLAGEWKVNLKGLHKDPLEMLAFILLLASYKLASDFDANEILEYLEFIAERRQVPEICRALGLPEVVSDLIESLIRKNRHLVAVRFIVACELGKKFPPVPLLKNYLWISKKIIKARRHMENNSVEAQDKSIDEKVACMTSVVSCIVNHKLKCRTWCDNLEKSIKRLQEHQKRTECTFIVKSQAQRSDDDNVVSSITAPVRPKDFRSTFDPTNQVLAGLLSNMNGKNLLLFLNKHVEEHELMRKEVSVALQMSFDSGKLVLDAIQGFFTSHLMKGDNIEATVVRTSIFLLEILMKLSPVIKPQVKGVARKVAVDWKANMHTTSPLATLGFLIFVGTYKLTSSFDSDELRKLYHTIAMQRLAPELFHALGFSEEIPASNNLELWEKIDQPAPEDLRLRNTVSSSSVSHLHSLWDEIPDPIRYAPDPAKMVLDVVEGCYYSMLKNRDVLKVEVTGRLNFLLTKLLRVSLEVRPQVKDQAKKLAADWKEKVVCQDSSEVECLLLLLATYKVISSFNTDELFGFLEIVYNRGEAIDLFHSLGLADEVPDFIRRLIDRGLHLDAIKYVKAFDLLKKFPPVTLLKGYISYADEAAEKIREEGHYSFNAREIALKNQVNAFKAVMNCVRLHKLELPHPLEHLDARIEQLETQGIDLKVTNKRKHKRKGFVPDLDSKAKFGPHPPKKLRRAALSAGATLNCSGSSFYPFQPRQPPYMSRIGPGAQANGGYPPFGFDGDANFDSGPYYNARPVARYWQSQLRMRWCDRRIM